MVKKRGENFLKSSFRNNYRVLILFLLLSIFIVSGQQGCPPQGGGPGTTTDGQRQPTTEAQRVGVDFSLVEGIDFIYRGKKIQENEPFSVNFVIENSAELRKGGTICIRDDLEDVYGGIKSETCKAFNVGGAVYEGGKIVSVGKTNVVFEGPYKYVGLPISQDINLFIKMRYADMTSASAPVAVPEPQSERLQVTQAPSPLRVTMEKTVSPREEGYLVSLGIEMRNTKSDTSIYTQDYTKKGVIFNPRFSQTRLECDYTQLAVKYVEIDPSTNTKFIKCSGLLPREQITYPFVLDLIYGVEVNKKITFRVEKEGTA